MAGYKNKFSNRKHAVGGIVASGMALISVLLFVLSVILSYKAEGFGGTSVGTVALLSLAFSVFGLIFGLTSYREINKYYTFSAVGSVASGIMVVFLIMLMVSAIV